MPAQTTVQVRGHTIGAGPLVYIAEDHLTFGPAAIRSTVYPAPGRDGESFGGADQLGGRELLVPVLIWTHDAGTTKAERLALAIEEIGDLAQAWRPAEQDLTLRLHLGGLRQLVTYGRPRPLVPESIKHLHRGVQGAVLRWAMSRPYVFDADAVETTIDVLGAAEAGGLGYPHGYPHGYGGEAVQGQGYHEAGGRVRTWPMVVLRAGELDTLRNPTIVNDSSGAQLGLNATIDQSADLVIDMYHRRVYAVQPGADVLVADPASVALVDRSATVRHPDAGTWWDVGPESTPIRLLGSGAGTAHILTRAAYWL